MLVFYYLPAVGEPVFASGRFGERLVEIHVTLMSLETENVVL